MIGEPLFVDAIASYPPSDRKTVAPRLADLAEGARQAGSTGLVDLLAAHPSWSGLLAALADHSPFLWRLALADPARLLSFATTPLAHSHAAILAAQAGIGPAFASGILPHGEAVRALRRNRAAHALLVGLADLGGVWSVDAVTQALSDFADRSVQSALAIVLAQAAAKRGGSGAAEGCGLVVLALGKHGAGELNYSSDIDLVVFYDPECGVVDPGESSAHFSRLARDLAKLLQERTPDGYVHRVDYRLRPDPASTPVAVSLPAAYGYYETVGQNWERAAFIKARPIAGDLALGERFLAELTPFIWRKYFDFAAIADIHAMKRQIHAVRGHEAIAVAGHDIKLGRGGIREIEFFVQTQQLVFGGRRPALRGRRTLDMLGALHDEGWIGAAARDELRACYRFLRGVEHRLQMVADEQTQRLPADATALRTVARLCGCSGIKAFSAALTRVAEQVQGHYALLFEEGPDLASDLGSLVFTGSEDDPETLATLARLGFHDPRVVAETVRGWHFGRRAAVTSARAREVLTELTPALLAALGGTADPDGALARLDSAFGRMPAAVELMTILQSNERLRLLFADLLGTAPRLAEVVAQSPHVLDAVIDPAFVSPDRDPAAIAAQLAEIVGVPGHFEEFLDRIRGAARQLRFLIGARMLSEVLSPTDAGLAYAALADGIVALSLAAVRAAFAQDHGVVPGGRIAILALGRLGARDLTATSDLDLLILYDFDPDRRISDGARPLDAAVYFTRLTQRLVAALTVPTRRGRLYEVDLRLRPAGGKGPIAVQFKGFLPYQREEAELWEHLALTRARPIAGDASLTRAARDAIATILARPRDSARVRAETLAMRRLIAREKGEGDVFDIKLAAGGLTDLDFIAQSLVVTHAGEHDSLLWRSTPEVIGEAARLGLVGADDARGLCEAYRLFDDLLHWQRLTIEGRFAEAEAAPAILKRLATVAGVPDAAVLRAHLAEAQAGVRSMFEHLMR